MAICGASCSQGHMLCDRLSTCFSSDGLILRILSHEHKKNPWVSLCTSQVFCSQNLKHETDVDIIAGSQWLIPKLEVIALCIKLEDCWGQKYCIAELTKLTVCLGEQNPSFLAYFPWTNPSIYPMCFSRRDLSSPTCCSVAVVGIVVICGLQ